MEGYIMRAFYISVSAAILSIASFSVSADYTIDKGSIRLNRHQDVVITISKNPVQHVEEACLALTMGQILRQSGKKVNVTVFLRNDGVFLADRETIKDAREDCAVPDPKNPTMPKFITLEENLTAFLDGNPNNLVNCPLCWGARVQMGLIGNPMPDFGVLANEAVPPVLLGADKVIDF
jgi:hypothetical protein